MEEPLTYDLKDLQNKDLDVLIIGSGPAAVAVVEHLYPNSNATIGILERGGILTTTHVSNMLREMPGGRLRSPVNRRERFIKAHERFLWEGDFKAHGMMITALGGRGIVAGAQLRRFYSPDFTLWDNAHWPSGSADLSNYYTLAEVRRHVRPGDCDGAAQNWVLGQLNFFGASPPPWGVDSQTVRNLEAAVGYDSSVSRLWMLVIDDHEITVVEQQKRRLNIATHAYATRIEKQGARVTAVVCKDSRDERADAPEIRIGAKIVVLAASPIESARLMLNSRLGNQCTGHFLAEHMYCRRSISIAPPSEISDVHRLAIRVVVPPQSRDYKDRFQVEVLGEEDPDQPGRLLLRFTGEGAMQPRTENRVTLAISNDGQPLTDFWGVQKAHVTFLPLEQRPEDRTRFAVMKDTIWRMAEKLGVKEQEFFKKEDIELLPAGRSHHEAGTLRMGHIDDRAQPSVTDPSGRVHDLDNLYVADASVFPCVGVANPMLTITALGYRLADHIEAKLSGASRILEFRHQTTRTTGVLGTPMMAKEVSQEDT